jgi:CheY-like chemotaxis protein
VNAFESTLRCDSSPHGRFDLIIMDKEMPTSEPEGYRTAGASAVKRIRELSLMQAAVEPGFTCPCIIGNSACTDENDPTWIKFRDELQLARQQAGAPNSLLILKEKLSSWSDAFDQDVRRLCGLSDASAGDGDEAPTVWGKPIRLEMMVRNLITNAIQHGKQMIHPVFLVKPNYGGIIPLILDIFYMTYCAGLVDCPRKREDTFLRFILIFIFHSAFFFLK